VASPADSAVPFTNAAQVKVIDSASYASNSTGHTTAKILKRPKPEVKPPAPAPDTSVDSMINDAEKSLARVYDDIARLEKPFDPDADSNDEMEDATNTSHANTSGIDAHPIKIFIHELAKIYPNDTSINVYEPYLLELLNDDLVQESEAMVGFWVAMLSNYNIKIANPAEIYRLNQPSQINLINQFFDRSFAMKLARLLMNGNEPGVRKLYKKQSLPFKNEAILEQWTIFFEGAIRNARQETFKRIGKM
jgi:hypothetical protein